LTRKTFRDYYRTCETLIKMFGRDPACLRSNLGELRPLLEQIDAELLTPHLRTLRQGLDLLNRI